MPESTPETGLAHIKIILVEPSGALNVGSVARVMKNMGLNQMVLVNPQCDWLSPEARQMAVHAIDVLEAAQEVATLPAALRGCQKAIATTGRDRTAPSVNLEPARTTLPWLLEASSHHPSWQSALIFGREDRGLTKEELNYAQRSIRIPSSDIYPSLNLAQAVAICCYELYVYVLERKELSDRQPETSFPSSLTPVVDLASLDTLEGYYQQLEALLLKIGYLYPHTSASRMEKLRRLYNRADLSDPEVAMLRGVLSQVEWALYVQQSDSR
ncbi:MAG: RNA methyltransferase [Leptolyngbyaceae cyanobacterium CRU_2_3]|nr:RNA methyltransferase [Leptolyngbyaceae cyanobacterium CRU_2_3]